MEKDLINVPQGEIVSSDIVKQIAFRLQKTYVAPKRRQNMSDQEYQAIVVQPEDFPVVVELAMAQGHNPLSKTFHYWKQDGRIMVDDHYAPLLNWAQSKAPFTYTTEIVSDTEKASLEGIDPGDYVVRFHGLKRADQKARQEYFKIVLDSAIAAGKEFEEALELADRKADKKFGIEAIGVVKFNEIHYQSNGKWVLNVYATPKGWIPGITRAEVRAVRNGIKRLVGVPMPEERKRLGLEISMQEVAHLAASVPQEIVEQGVADEWMRLEAEVQNNNRQYQEKVANLTPEQNEQRKKDNIDLIRGKADEPGIGDEAEEVPFEITGKEPETVIAELVKDAESLGGLVIADDPNDREISLEEAAAIAIDSYKTEIALGEALELFFQKTSLVSLTDVERWNFAQYCLRRDILMNTSIALADRLKALPEIQTSSNPPKTMAETKTFIHDTLTTLTQNNKKMRRLTINE